MESARVQPDSVGEGKLLLMPPPQHPYPNNTTLTPPPQQHHIDAPHLVPHRPVSMSPSQHPYPNNATSMPLPQQPPSTNLVWSDHPVHGSRQARRRGGRQARGETGMRRGHFAPSFMLFPYSKAPLSRWGSVQPTCHPFCSVYTCPMPLFSSGKNVQ